MAQNKLGELLPVGGGDPIPLYEPSLSIGRRDSCDICLRFQNVSGKHSELSFQNGFWMIRDLRSANGTLVKGERITPGSWKPLQPGDEVAFSKQHRYTIQYALLDATALEQAMAEEEDVFGQSLLEKAGLQKPKDEDDD